MKKLFLLCALTLISVSALNGMEPEKPNYMAMLPQEVRKLIVSALTQSNTIEEAINAIRSLTQTNKEFNAIINDPITTRTIIRLLVQKFNAPSEYIAMKLSTPGSQQYIWLGVRLQTALSMKDFTRAEKLIKKGADIDIQKIDMYPMFCGQSKSIGLLLLLSTANIVQTTITNAKQSLLFLQENPDMPKEEIMQRIGSGDKQAFQQLVETYQSNLDNLMPIINNGIQASKDIFENDEQFNHLVAEINKGNFKKALTILAPKTIMTQSPTRYWYQIGETTEQCMIGANFSMVMYAVATNQIDLLQWLTKHNANLELTMGTGDTALLMAINLGNKEIVELLIENKANLNQKKILNINEETRNKIHEFSFTPLQGTINNMHYMYRLLNLDTLALIFKNGLDIYENTPLISLLSSDQFTEEEQYDLVKLLLDSGANPNMQDAYGNTPLLFAFSLESKFIRLLLDHGADPSLKDNDGLTALERITQPEENNDAEENPEEEEDPEREVKIKLLESAMKKQSSVAK